MTTRIQKSKRLAVGRCARPAAKPAGARRLASSTLATSATWRSTKGAAGLALVAGAAGLALKNRDKLTSMIRRGPFSHELVAPQPVPMAPARPETNGADPLLSSTEHPTA